jgi:hypothetical protein
MFAQLAKSATKRRMCGTRLVVFAESILTESKKEIEQAAMRRTGPR